MPDAPVSERARELADKFAGPLYEWYLGKRRMSEMLPEAIAAFEADVRRECAEVAERECRAVWRCAIGDSTSALDILKDRWLKSRRKAERDAGATLAEVLDHIWAARDPAAINYNAANANGKVLHERIKAILGERGGEG